MKASELIKLLEEKVKEHGDLDVKINNYYTYEPVVNTCIEKKKEVEFILIDCEE